MRLHDAWFLLLLVPVALIAWRMLLPKKWAAVGFSDTTQTQKISGGIKAKLMWLCPVLKVLALVLLVVCLARPQSGIEKTKIFTEGIAIEMVLDRSSSMEALDFTLDNQRVNRLAAIKSVATRFIEGDKALNLPGRQHDMIGMITFARYADNLCPLTLDHSYLVHKIDEIQIVNTQDEDGTAIGDALGLAVERLDALKDEKKPDGTNRIKSKIIILLTDGDNNAGDLAPLDAAELAKAHGIKVYTIGVGTQGMAAVPFIDAFTGKPAIDPFTGARATRMVPVRIDEATLKKIAKLTGGEYFRATDTQSLEKIYTTIDKLEKTVIQQRKYAEYRELSVKPFRLYDYTFPPLLLIAFALLGVEALLGNTWLRKVP